MPASDEDDELDRLFNLDAIGSPNLVPGTAPSANSAAAPPTRANMYDIDEEIKFVKKRRAAPKLDETRYADFELSDSMHADIKGFVR